MSRTRTVNLLHLPSSMFAVLSVQKKTSAFESLPQEILMAILELLTPASRIDISLASKHIAHIACHTALQWDLNSLTKNQRETLTSDDQMSFYLMSDYT